MDYEYAMDRDGRFFGYIFFFVDRKNGKFIGQTEISYYKLNESRLWWKWLWNKSKNETFSGNSYNCIFKLLANVRLNFFFFILLSYLFPIIGKIFPKELIQFDIMPEGDCHLHTNDKLIAFRKSVNSKSIELSAREKKTSHSLIVCILFLLSMILRNSNQLLSIKKKPNLNCGNWFSIYYFRMSTGRSHSRQFRIGWDDPELQTRGYR